MYRPVFTGALPASKGVLYLPINFHRWQARVVCDELSSLLLLAGSSPGLQTKRKYVSCSYLGPFLRKGIRSHSILIPRWACQ